MTAITDAARYVEPEQINEEVIVNVKTGDVRKGDLIVGFPGRVVESWVRGPKWSTFRDAAGKDIVRFASGSEVPVNRLQETEESYAARRRARSNLSLCESIQEAQKSAATAAEEFNKNLAEYGTVDHWRLDNLLTAQAKAVVWGRFGYFADKAQVSDAVYFADKAQVSDAVEASEIYIERLKEDLYGTSANRALSRSTSVTINLLEDVDREAKAEFIYGMRWGF